MFVASESPRTRDRLTSSTTAALSADRTQPPRSLEPAPEPTPELLTQRQAAKSVWIDKLPPGKTWRRGRNEKGKRMLRGERQKAELELILVPTNLLLQYFQSQQAQKHQVSL